MATIATPQVSVEDCGPFKRYIFPSGESVAYRDKDHSYWAECKEKTVKGEVVWTGTAPRFAGVSTVVDPYDFRPDNLMKWAAETDQVGVARVFGGRECPRDPAQIRSALWASRVTWQQAREEKADTGKAAHALILHQLALGNEPDLDVLLPSERGFGQSIYRWWLERDPKVLHAEQVVTSVENCVAGTFDLRVELDSSIGLDHREGIALIDAKARGYIPASSLAQVCGYDKLVVDCGLGRAADHLMILKLHEDGSMPTEIWVEDGKSPDERHEGFLDALRVYRRAADYAKQVGR